MEVYEYVDVNYQILKIVTYLDMFCTKTQVYVNKV